MSNNIGHKQDKATDPQTKNTEKIMKIYTLQGGYIRMSLYLVLPMWV